MLKLFFPFKVCVSHNRYFYHFKDGYIKYFLQIELQALHDLYDKSEEMWSSLSNDNVEAEEKIRLLTSEKKMLVERLEDDKIDENSLKASYNYFA